MITSEPINNGEWSILYGDRAYPAAPPQEPPEDAGFAERYYHSVNALNHLTGTAILAGERQRRMNTFTELAARTLEICETKGSRPSRPLVHHGKAIRSKDIRIGNPMETVSFRVATSRRTVIRLADYGPMFDTVRVPRRQSQPFSLHLFIGDAWEEQRHISLGVDDPGRIAIAGIPPEEDVWDDTVTLIDDYLTRAKDGRVIEP